MEYEVDTLRLIEHCNANNIAVAIPGIVDDEMKFFYVNPISGIVNLGEAELASAGTAVCVVPGLAFDKSNYRLGFGGGYYDRFLQNFNGISNSFSIGLCYNEFITDIPVEAHDQPVNIIVTD